MGNEEEREENQGEMQSGSGVGDSVYTEREVVVATGASEYLDERALDEEEERTITESVHNGCGCRMGKRGPALHCSRESTIEPCVRMLQHCPGMS